MLSNIKNLSLTKKLAYKIVFFIFCLIPFFSGLDSIPPLDRDESRFVQSTYQMIETNDYINIKFLDEIRAKKVFTGHNQFLLIYLVKIKSHHTDTYLL